MKDHIEELLDSYDLTADEKEMVRSEALRKEAEAYADLAPGEDVQTTYLYFQDALAEFLAKKELYEKDLVQLAEQYAESKQQESKQERVLPYPELGPMHYLNNLDEISKNQKEDSDLPYWQR